MSRPGLPGPSSARDQSVPNHGNAVRVFATSKFSPDIDVYDRHSGRTNERSYTLAFDLMRLSCSLYAPQQDPWVGRLVHASGNMLTYYTAEPANICTANIPTAPWTVLPASASNSSRQSEQDPYPGRTIQLA